MSRTKSLLCAQIEELMDGERQLLEAVPEIVREVHDPELADVLLDHHAETQTHVERLKQISDILRVTPTGSSNEVIRTLISQASAQMHAAPDTSRDSRLILIMHRIEQFEVAAYNTAAAYAEILAEDQIVELLTATLDEEAVANEVLTDIATYPEEEGPKDDDRPIHFR